MRTVWTTVRGSRMHAVATGEGPPVVLVHGYGVSGTYMLLLARALAPSCSVFVPDLPGQGRSAALRSYTSMSDLADALDELVGGERLRPAAGRRELDGLPDRHRSRRAAAGSRRADGTDRAYGRSARRAARHQLFAALRDSAREPLSLIALAARDNAAARRTLLATARFALADRIEDRAAA